MPVPSPAPTPDPAPDDQLTPDQLADAQRYLTALQSVGATALSNATQLKKLLDQLTPAAEEN